MSEHENEHIHEEKTEIFCGRCVEKGIAIGRAEVEKENKNNFRCDYVGCESLCDGVGSTTFCSEHADTAIEYWKSQGKAEGENHSGIVFNAVSKCCGAGTLHLPNDCPVLKERSRLLAEAERIKYCTKGYPHVCSKDPDSCDFVIDWEALAKLEGGQG